MNPLIRVEEGDIAGFHGDAVVNAANNHLRMGSGVAGALASRGGPTIQADCDDYVRKNGPLAVGGAALTGAGDLPARWVIHAAAMGDEPASDRSIRDSTRRSLEIARDQGMTSVAFPVLGTGVAGYSFDAAARAMVEEVRAFGTVHDKPETVVFYGYTAEQAAHLRRLLE